MIPTNTKVQKYNSDIVWCVVYVDVLEIVRGDL